PGDRLDIEIDWYFIIPPYGGARMGRDGPLYEIAQWYPRLAVYDDVRGWNNEPYIGAGEFYLEYGDFDVTLDLPAAYVAVATGELQNAEQVLTQTQRDRLARAIQSETPVAIITREEAGDTGRTRPTASGRLNWHFTASNVRDFAFAASPNFRWDAAGYDGILIEALYRTSAPKWEEGIRMAVHSIKTFSEMWYRYPYSHATTVEGPIEGMEYPMLTFVPDNPRVEDLQWVLAHEFGHEWFPMVVGSNERFYPWMDEGFNTFMDLYVAADYYKGTPYGESIEWNPLAIYPENAVPGKEQPLITRPAEQYNLFWTAYQKPALMLQLLRHEVLGPERFDRAFRAYIAAWAYKHPTPADFFRIMRDVSGMDLDWFWRGWVMTAARLDQSVLGLEARPDGGTNVVLVNQADMVMPLELKVDFADGATETFKLPVEMWNQGPRFTYRIPGTRSVRAVEIDPRHRMPDSNRANNRWSAGN
ncbi:MAG: M1 family metallopeptidase, partial [Rhodothermales bacterium]